MKIDNFYLYELEEAIVASGLPMVEDYYQDDFFEELNDIDKIHAETPRNQEELKRNSSAIQRACKLANNPSGSGHCNFLSGILVACNVTATNAWWLQLERYHFVQIVSMQSKMHRLKKMIETGTVMGNEKAHKSLEEFAEKYKDCEDIETLVYNCPMGLTLTGRIATNYLQLKTIYQQRKNHRLNEWREFCEWIEKLPYAKEFITCGNHQKD